MRFVGVLALVVACVACGSPSPHPNGSPDANGGPVDGMCPGPTAPLCSTTCGNGMLDQCAVMGGLAGEDCETWATISEVCDGALQTETCASLGYYGGSAACSDICTFDPRGCNVCAGSCAAASGIPTFVAASGSNVGVALEQTNGFALAILDGALDVTATAAIDEPAAFVAVPTGWLLVSPQYEVQLVDLAGNVTTQPAIPAMNSIITGLAYGAGGRALVVWNDYVASEMPAVMAELLDGSGAQVGAPFQVFAADSDDSTATIATDGASFFVAAKGQLAVVTADGAIAATVAGYPDGGIASWSGSNGWYVAATDALGTTFTAQRFDATGALVGAPIAISSPTALSGLQGYGDGLVAVSVVASQSVYRVAVARIAATGAIAATTDAGVSEINRGIVAPFGSGVAAAWFGADSGRISLVTP